MKKIRVVVEAELEVPENWEVIKDYLFAEGEDFTVHALKTDEGIITFDLEFFKANDDKNGFTSCDEDLSNAFIDMMGDSVECTIEEVK